MLWSLRISSLVFLFVFSAVHAQAQLSEGAQMSATVVKAEFGETIWALSQQEDGVYALSIRVPNSGSLEATDVEVTVSTLVDWEVISMEPEEFAIAIVDKSPYNRIRWSIPSIASGESIELTATFELKKQMETVPLDISVESPVSAPVEIGTLVEEDDTDRNLDKNGESSVTPSSWPTKFLDWIVGIIDRIAAWLNGLYDRLVL